MNEKLKIEIRKFNKVSTYKIKYRKRKYDYALYLDLQRKNDRRTINLSLFVSGKISFLIEDKAILNHAIQQQRMYDKQYKFNNNKNLITKKRLQEMNIIDYIYTISDRQKVNSTKLNWRSIIKHLKAFSGNNIIRFREIDRKFCLEFADYLRHAVSPNTGNGYFAKFKQALYKSIEDGIIDHNPATRITIKKKSTYREFLSLDEIEKIYNMSFYKPVLKNAFIFSCFTGLRFVDIKDLKFEDITDSFLIFTQNKTDEPLRIKLHPIANEIIDMQKEELKRDKGVIFELPKYENCRYNMHLLIKKSGIDKRITFHCGRHTFATLCLTYDIDLYTVSKLLGHTDIKHTQIYAKLIDKKRDEAIDKLPTFRRIHG
jgi:integrase